MLKGTSKITKELNNFLKPYEIKCRLGVDFCFYPIGSLNNRKPFITWSLVIANKHDKTFKKFITDELGYNYKGDMFILDFFHELGHYMTDNTLTEKDRDICDTMREYIENKNKLTEKDYYKYYNLKDEKLATTWAVNYIINHKKEVQELWNTIQPLILNVYKLNKVKLD